MLFLQPLQCWSLKAGWLPPVLWNLTSWVQKGAFHHKTEIKLDIGQSKSSCCKKCTWNKSVQSEQAPLQVVKARMQILLCPAQAPLECCNYIRLLLISTATPMRCAHFDDIKSLSRLWLLQYAHLHSDGFLLFSKHAPGGGSSGLAKLARFYGPQWLQDSTGLKTTCFAVSLVDLKALATLSRWWHDSQILPDDIWVFYQSSNRPQYILAMLLKL